MKKFIELPFVEQYKSSDKGKIIRYVECMYDKDSKLNMIDDLDERKRRACELSMLNAEDHPNLLNLVKDTDEAHLVFLYLSYFQNNNKYHMLQANIQLLQKMQKDIMEGDDMEKAIKWSEKSDQLLARINRQKSELYGSKDVIEVADHEIRKEVMMKTPESRLKKTA